MEGAEFKREILTDRELEIAGWLREGLTTAQMAHNAQTSRKIILAHIRNMITKLNAGNTSGLREKLNQYRENG